MRSLACSLLLSLSACAASRAIAPLEPGRGALTASLGGPMFDFGAPIPTPLLVAGYRHGVTGHTAIKGSIHATPLLMFGVFGFDVGSDTELFPPKGARPRLMFDQVFTFAFGDNVQGEPDGGLAIFPSVGLIASWDVRRHHLYVGAQVFDQLVPARYTYPYPIAGVVLASRRVDWQLEVGWPALTSSNLPNFLTWIAPAGQGAISLQLGASVHLGKRP